MTTDLQTRYFATALILAGGCFVATTLAVPYFLVMVPKLRHAPLPLPLLSLALAAQAAVPALLLGWAGLELGSRVNLGAPVLRAWMAGSRPILAHGWAAAGLGLAGGGLCLLIDRAFLLPTQPAAIRALASQGEAWRGFLAALYGGIVEEVLVRLFLMTALAWLLSKFAPRQPPGMFVAAAILSGVLFAAGHLPAAAKIVPLDAVVVGRVLAMNTVAGVGFGLVYWRWGLEHAMICHVCADVVLHSMGG